MSLDDKLSLLNDEQRVVISTVSRQVLLVNSKGIELNLSPNKKNGSKKFRLRKNLHRWGGAMNYLNYTIIMDHNSTMGRINRNFALRDQAMDTAVWIRLM